GGIPGPVSAKATSTAAASTEPEIRIALRREPATASRAFVNRLMNTCSSWMGLPTITGSSGPRSTVTSISRSRSCSRIRTSARLDELLLFVAQLYFAPLHLGRGLPQVPHDVNHGFPGILQLQLVLVRVLQDVEQSPP